MSRYYVDGAVTPQFAKMMVWLAEAIGVRVAESTIRIYAEMLGDIEVEDLRRVFRAIANEPSDRRTFMPGVPEIRRHLQPTGDDAALLAWTALNAAASDVGAWASIDIEDGAAAEAVQMVFGSWPAFCEMEDGPALAIKRQEFMAAYRQAARVRRAVDAVRLPGLCAVAGTAPPLELASSTWVARVALTGHVQLHRDAVRALPPGGNSGALQLEGADAETGEGGAQAGRAEGGARSSAAGGGA